MVSVNSVVPGLSQDEAKRRLEKHGRNAFEDTRRFSIIKLVWSQFTSPLIYILIVAMGVTWFLGDTVDTLVIGLAVGVNTILGFWQEYKAERDLEQLASVLSPRAVVVRDQQRYEIDAEEIVPGDVVWLEAGERVPADGVLVKAAELKVNEAILTGESVPVYKQAAGKRGLHTIAMAESRLDRVRELFNRVEEREHKGKESVYMGTTVMAGSATMLVAFTGGETQIGEIAGKLLTTQDESTPLQEKLKSFSNRLAVMVLGLAALIFVVGILAGDSFLEMFTLAVAVAVSSIPEGLVVSLTAILAIGMQRILKREALVRKLVAAEVLGSVSVICSDKTGTLTEGNMSVKVVELVDEKLGLAACLVTADMKDPMEVALWEWASSKLGEGSAERVMHEYERLDRKPFASETKYSATLTQKELFVLGAPEVLMGKSKMGRRSRSEWEETVAEYARKGYRIIGIAHRKRRSEETITNRLLDKPWYWLGLIVYEDKVRIGVKTQLQKTKQAGIGLKVITGDYRETAMHVLRELGVKVTEEEVMEGWELEQIAPGELDQKIGEIRLFARTSPNQKLKIVEALQRKGEVVAMTGDGVNDAPSLKKADIGIVVSTASDVSKETADMVLLNNDFSTIVAAVEEGRGIFANLRKVLLYLLSDSFSEVILVIGSLALGLPLPITAAQILWVNLANDGLPNLALTVDPKEKGLLKQKPRDPHESIVDLEIGTLIGLISLVTGGLVLLGFWWYWQTTGDLIYARTMAFTMLGVDSLLYVFSSRSLSRPIWRDHPWRNPWLVGAVLIGLMIQLAALYVPFFQELLETVPLTVRDWVIVLAVSGVVMGVIEVTKVVFLRWDLSNRVKDTVQ